MFDTQRFVLLLLSLRWLLLVWSGVVVLPGNLHPVEQNTCRDGNEQTLQCTETKRGRQKRGHGDGEGEHSEDDYEGNDEPAESRSSSFPTSPPKEGAVHSVLCLSYKDKDQCCIHIIDDAKDVGVHSIAAVLGVVEKTPDKSVFVAVCA